MIEAKNLVKNFKGLQAVSDVSFQVEQGVITGMIGPNGAGKTTVFNMICGYCRPTAGKVFYKGGDITGKAAYEFAEIGIARTFQIMKPLRKLTVLDNVASSAFFGRCKAKTLSQAREIARETLDFTGLYGKRNVLAGDMGTPDQKRLEMARALAARPEMLFLDEVMAGLTPAETEDAIELIKRINANGVTVFLIEHIMKAVVSLCKEVIVLHHGEKIAAGTPHTVMNDPYVNEVYLGRKKEGAADAQRQ